MSDLDQYMPGKVAVFNRDSDDSPVSEEVVLVDVVDNTEDTLEVAFNIGRKRVYLMLPAKQLLAALKE